MANIERIFRGPNQAIEAVKGLFQRNKQPASQKIDAAASQEVEGLVPYIELFRLMRTHQYDLAQGLYRVYGDRFSTTDLHDYEDYAARVTVSGQRQFGRKNIHVWLTPEQIEEETLAREILEWKYPWLTFHYNLRQGEWVYGGADLHKKMEPKVDHPGWKWAPLNSDFDLQDPKNDWLSKGAVRIDDLERILGRYLHRGLHTPQSELVL